MVEQLFDVATEFHFEVGQAMLNTKALQGAVDDLSKSADGALNSLNYLASGLSARLGFGSGGLLSILTKAVQLSEAFDSSALNFSSTIQQNLATSTDYVYTFNEGLLTSKKILGDISAVAIKNALPTGQLANLSQHLYTPLANRGKGGTNMSGAIEMSKNIMLGAPSLGVDPMTAGNAVYQALTDRMALPRTMFARLANTPQFKSAHVSSQQQLSNMNPDKKIDLLSAALKHLATDSDALNFRLNTLHGQFTILQDLFSEVGSILTPLGEVIKKPLVMALKYVTKYFTEHGKEFGENIAKLLGGFMQTPEAMVANLVQMKRLGGDVKKAFHAVELFGIAQFLRDFMGLPLFGGMIFKVFRGIFSAMKWIVTTVPWMEVLSGALTLLRTALVNVAAPFLFFLTIFQIFSRAKGLALAHDLQNSIEATGKFAAVSLKLKNAFEKLLTPFNVVIDFFARLIAPLMETTFWLKIGIPLLERFSDIVDWIGERVLNLTSALYGLVGVIVESLESLFTLKRPRKMMDIFNEDANSFYSRVKSGEFTKAVQNEVNNTYVTARFDMREQLEPDRIAFAVTQSLKKLVLNPTQGRGQTVLGFTSGKYPEAPSR